MSDRRLLPDSPVADLEAYTAAGGGAGLARAREIGAEATIELLAAAGLRGRGGAGFPTATKWRSVLAQARPDDDVHLVANAAEGEPGTAKDRRLLLDDPYVFLEGLLIGLTTLDARAAHIGTKASFVGVLDRLRSALDEIVEAGWHRAEDVRIVEGPDEYLFGEESALLEVIEGGDARPRILKPYEAGLYATPDAGRANPTVVNNVETLGHAARILAEGAEWFREVGTDESPGTMLCTVVGDVATPGVYEVPLGIDLGELLVDIAGAEDPKLILSGVSNPVMTAAHLLAPLGFDTMRTAQGGLGSGGFVVYDQGRSVVRALRTAMRFLGDESCGQCNSCILHTNAAADLLDQLVDGTADEVALDALVRHATSSTDAIRCYLPVGGQAMVTSAIALFGQEFVDAARDGAPDGDRDYPVPLIDEIDEDTGDVVFSAKAQPGA